MGTWSAIVKITELSQVFDKKLRVLYPDVNGNWMANFDYGEVMDDGVLIGECGRGKSPDAALKDYASKIAGKRMVFNAYTDQRVELEMPSDLEA